LFILDTSTNFYGLYSDIGSDVSRYCLFKIGILKLEKMFSILGNVLEPFVFYGSSTLKILIDTGILK